MRATEFIVEDISRRGFLKGVGAAALAGGANAGQYQSSSEISPEQIQQIWKPRMAELQTRCDAIIKSFAGAVTPDISKIIQNTKIKITLGDSRFNAGNAAQADYGARPGTNGVPLGVPYGQIFLETTVFWDAPNDTLAFILGHELGHIIQEHRSDSLEKSRNNELEADRIGAYLAQKIGYNKANFYQFLHNKKAELLTHGGNSSHPEPIDRVKNLKNSLGFELSNNTIKYIDSLDHQLKQGVA
jgi:hypothetical protein